MNRKSNLHRSAFDADHPGRLLNHGPALRAGKPGQGSFDRGRSRYRVPQQFYRRFAEFMCEHGFDTLTLDYRGIKACRPSHAEGFRMDYLDWARQDLAAAVELMADECGLCTWLGILTAAMLSGLPAEPSQGVQALYTFATGAGWHGWMPVAERVRVIVMWNIVGPLLTRWKGYLAWSKLGMGEDLPLDLFRQWRHWCRFPHYFFDDPAMAHLTVQFDAVRSPICRRHPVDDLWAPPASQGDAFMAGYRQAPVQTTITLRPADFGLRTIGHMGYFKAQAHPLWQQVLDWLESTRPRFRRRLGPRQEGQPGGWSDHQGTRGGKSEQTAHGLCGVATDHSCGGRGLRPALGRYRVHP
ncbi:MAG: hypothetical protein R3F37_02450 [Candidatus Competibacteraceae bacterium]